MKRALGELDPFKMELASHEAFIKLFESVESALTRMLKVAARMVEMGDQSDIDHDDSRDALMSWASALGSLATMKSNLVAEIGASNFRLRMARAFYAVLRANMEPSEMIDFPAPA